LNARTRKATCERPSGCVGDYFFAGMKLTSERCATATPAIVSVDSKN
jgi:hypothetical protein